MSICVFGSLNLDLVVQTPHLPLPGETLLGLGFQQIPGGKGANQAVAAARAGAIVSMVGRVGQDVWGHLLLENLKANQVETIGIVQDPTEHTGVAFITVAQNGDNQIVLAAGANGAVAAEDLEQLRSLLPQTEILLLQLEVPLAQVVAAAEMAQDAGVTVILDPAPVPPHFPPSLYPLIDILTPNQGEASQLLGMPIDSIQTAKQGVRQLQEWGVSIPIITLGEAGVVWFSSHVDDPQHLPAFPVQAIDTTAAGDAFNGALAAALLQSVSLDAGILWGMAAAALAVQQPGAQPSLPDRAQIEAFLETARTLGEQG
ncbi:MAG: ribokinase [Prochlorotrichaceae cyanobacterium]